MTKTSAGHPVVVGVAEHTGWAIFVCAAAVKGEPVVVDRRRVRLLDEGLPGQPYEHDTRALAPDEAEHLLGTVRTSIAARTAAALDHLAGDLAPGHRVSALAIREPTLASLPASAHEAHQSPHVLNRADGMLFHSALCAAARRRRWDVVLHRRGEELARAAAALRAGDQDVDHFIRDLKRALRPPWAADHRSAFAAAIAALGARSRLRMPGTR